MSLAATSRGDGLKRALGLERLTLAMDGIEAVGALVAAWWAGSLLLLAFGADSLIEILSAVVLYRRLRLEATQSASHDFEALERRASRVAGLLLCGLCLYVVGAAGWGLWQHHHARPSLLGLAIAVLAAFAMPVLARAKIKAADAIGSKALRADAMETFTCGYLSWALLAGLAATWALGWWWLDSAASLAVVPFLLKEAREALTGECGCGPASTCEDGCDPSPRCESDCGPAPRCEDGCEH